MTEFSPALPSQKNAGGFKTSHGHGSGRANAFHFLPPAALPGAKRLKS
ncbi:hypothetical protein MSL71_7230 [Desulfoluna butyratoxydans]|uniref:Uncharacterized protein n=1 Tax=Desulfoluna butyratoxydans TaxID=231438 RepID=A0A4U8YHN0_9BACT|nr:hypothetical protein MSL71_7230 [Desulfoluna butyratoxydans]